jgi:hypothetical protein
MTGRRLVLLPVITALTVGVGGCTGGSVASGVPAQAQFTAAAATRSTPAATEATAGSMVSDFPSRLVPLPPATTVTASAVQRHGDLLDVSVSATTTVSTTDLLAFYTKALGRAGFSATKGSVLPAGATGLAFGRGDGRELLVLAVVDRRSSRSFSIGGTVAAGA